MGDYAVEAKLERIWMELKNRNEREADYLIGDHAESHALLMKCRAHELERMTYNRVNDLIRLMTQPNAVSNEFILTIKESFEVWIQASKDAGYQRTPTWEDFLRVCDRYAASMLQELQKQKLDLGHVDNYLANMEKLREAAEEEDKDGE